MTALTWLAVRQVRLGAMVVVGLVAAMSAMVAATYRSTVGDSLDAAALVALARNPAIRTLFGEPVALDDPGGFTVWRTGTVLAVLVSVWALLAVTRITRGEEDSGRWDLLLAGRVPLAGAVTPHVVVVMVVAALAGLGAGGALVVVGTAPAGAFVHGAGLAVVGLFFAAVGGLAAQVFPTRSGATGAAVAVLGVGLLTRMVGDGVDALRWLRWLSPFGLTALTRPYEADRIAPLLVLAFATGAVFAATGLVARRRDVRGGWLSGRSGRAPRLWMLGSVEGFAVRRMLPPLAGWALGIGAYFLLIGLLAASMTEFLAANPRFADLAAQAGFAGLGTVAGYAATLFALLAIPAGVFVAVRLATVAADESECRLTPLFAQPITRTRVLVAEVSAALLGAAGLTVVAGLATWSGAAIAGSELGLGAALAGTVNVLSVPLLCAGAAVLALGWAPRAVAAVGALPAVGGFLLHVTAGSTDAPAWIGNLSPFAHLALVPDTTPNWTATAVMATIAVALTGTGAIGYRWRDLRT